ncbi:MAG: DUF4491 family protein [Chloroflexi bacterium]|nr:DUF4491 family protein [Chloroflexota bacterium]
MEINTIGLTAAITAFLSIWIGHVAVRKIEAASPVIWIPTVASILLGLVTEYCSLLTNNLHLKTAFGIIGVTLLWDALEFTRQQKRIIKGHAPANPNNPRHARILANSNFHATTHDLLKREPSGKRFTHN